MNLTGIITEYNPFHNGHLHHLTEAKKCSGCDGVVCIMSGNFVQRGGPALVDKWQRTAMALNNGVDLVIELPVYYAVSSAEFFAHGAVSILNSLGVINNIFFGSECGNPDVLFKIAQVLVNEPTSFKDSLKEHINSGLTYAKARENALIEYFNDDEISTVVSSSNNILGIEYIKSIIRLNSNITPMTLKREGAGYNEKELHTSFSSATSIREKIREGNSLKFLKKEMPLESFKILDNLEKSGYKFSFDEDMFIYLKYLLTTNCVNFNNLSEVIEGLDKKIIKEIINSSSYHEFILNIKSKRYTYSKISRILTHIYLGFYKENLSLINMDNFHYARVLGFNNKGREILSLIKANSSIPLITKVPRYNTNPLLDLDLSATRAYSILNPSVNPNSDYLISPIIKK